MPSQVFDLTDLWLISGRLHGDDDDTVEIISAPTQDEAEKAFMNIVWLANDIDQDPDENPELDEYEKEEQQIYIITSVALASRIPQRY